MRRKGHSSIQQVFTEQLQCVRPCCQGWMHQEPRPRFAGGPDVAVKDSREPDAQVLGWRLPSAGLGWAVGRMVWREDTECVAHLGHPWGGVQEAT